jgi:hypothetical protein
MQYDGLYWLDLADPDTLDCSLNCGILSLSITTNDNPVLAGYNCGLGRCVGLVSEYDGSLWTRFDDGIVLDGIDNNPSLAVDTNGNPVLAWVGAGEETSEIFVRRYEGGVWVELGDGSASGGGISSTGSNSDNPSLAVGTDGNLFVAWEECFERGCQQIFVKKFDGNSWVEVGTGSASGGGINQTDGGGLPSLAIDSTGNPVVAWQDVSMGEPEIYVKRFDGTSWVEIGTGSASAGGVSNSDMASNNPSLVIGGGRICVAWHEWGLDSVQIVMRCADE